MSLARDTALEVMGWQERDGARTHPHYGWDRAGRPSISRETWRPAYDLNQALEVLSHVMRGARWHVEGQGGLTTVYTVRSGDLTVGPSLSLPEAMCELALLVVRSAP